MRNLIIIKTVGGGRTGWRGEGGGDSNIACDATVCMRASMMKVQLTYPQQTTVYVTVVAKVSDRSST